MHKASGVRRAKEFFRSRFPFYARLMGLVHGRRYRGKDLTTVFSIIYRGRRFGGSASRSGPGSDLHHTALIRGAIPELIRDLGIRSMLDAPCGDYLWMKEIRHAAGLESYVGLDIVPELIEANNRLYADASTRFEVADITRDPLPAADLVLCRDCLVHLPIAAILGALRGIVQSRAKYLLTTSHPLTKTNMDIIAGLWRPLNLQLPPFDFPPPLQTIAEVAPGETAEFADKSLCLWTVADIEVGSLRGDGRDLGAAGGRP